MSSSRVVRGFGIAPGLMIGPVVLMHAILYFDAAAGERPVIAWTAAQMVGLTYGFALLIGLPVHLLLHATGRRGLIDYLLATAFGALLACLISAVFLDKWLFPADLERNPFSMTMWSRPGLAVTIGFVVVACITAALFWRIAIRQAPEMAEAT